jgi:hypothetical protein
MTEERTVTNVFVITERKVVANLGRMDPRHYVHPRFAVPAALSGRHLKSVSPILPGRK